MDLIGQPLLRQEDARLLRGEGRYSDDHRTDASAHLVVLRSPHAHARITAIDVAAAKAMAGVLMVATGQDYADAGLGGPHTNLPPLGAASRLRDGVINPPNLILARDRVRMVGEPVAIVVAETPAQARDAAEAIAVTYHPLPGVTDLAAALAPNAPQIWDEAPGNRCCEIEIGNAAACDAAFAAATHIISCALVNQRIYGCPMEPRAALAMHDPVADLSTIIAGHQLPNPTRDSLANGVFRIPPDRLRLISPDLGGGFGVRGQVFPELVFLLWAARSLNRRVHWLGERGECFASDPHARDSLWQGDLALDATGHILGLRVRSIANLGAYPGHAGPLVPVSAGPRVLTGNYRIPALDGLITVAFTNSATVAPYRGAGQPEAIYLIERLMDEAARQTGIDRITLRRRNLLRAEEMPFDTVAGATYDSGDYADAMTRALAAADWQGFPARRTAAAARGRLAGIGLANYVQVSGGAPTEWGALSILPDGIAEFRVGTHSHGQSHATTYAQIIAAQLGIAIDQVRIIEGDTALVRGGAGTHGSRSLFKAGEIMMQSCATIIARARRLAALRWNVAEDSISFRQGMLGSLARNDTMSLFEAAAWAAGADLPEDLATGLAVEQELTIFAANFPSGTHICELEIDPDTGAIAITRFTAIDDAGRLINPMVARGQMHGGIAQGIGQALCEQISYESETGQLLSASLLDYCLPRADDLPNIDVGFQQVASPTNQLGVKGIGESGPTGAPPALISAVLDALAPLGITHIDMPATPERVWRAICEARRTHREP